MLSENQILRARKALELLYTGKCTVTEHQKVKDRISKLISYEDKVVLEEQPCRLIFKSISPAREEHEATAAVQTVKLLLPPDIVVLPGSKITVTQNKITEDYTSSGIPALYMTHQEIVLELFERWV